MRERARERAQEPPKVSSPEERAAFLAGKYWRQREVRTGEHNLGVLQGRGEVGGEGEGEGEGKGGRLGVGGGGSLGGGPSRIREAYDEYKNS